MPRYFVAKRADYENAYELSNGEITCLGTPVIHFPLRGIEPKDAIEAQEKITGPQLAGPIIVEEANLNVGTFYPGVAKPLFGHGGSLYLPNADQEIQLSKSIWRELDVVKQDLEQCFDVTAIDQRNLSAFGTRYEQIIYFCCIGVESLFRRIFESSGALDDRILKKQYTTNDFVRLRKLLRIDEVGLSLVRYPWIDELRPFEGWSDERPSESLPWFQAYNLLKHDKRKNEDQACMKNALLACAAYYSIAYFTLGIGMFPGYLSTDIYLEFTTLPNWKLRDLYFKGHGETWSPIPIPV